MPRFRVGRSVPQNVYDKDEPAFQAHSDHAAERYVALMNLGERVETVTAAEIARRIEDAFDDLAESYQREGGCPSGRTVAEHLAPVVMAEVLLVSHQTPPSSPESAPEAQSAPVGPEDKLVDLMGALEESVKDAKASRARRRAELKAAYDGLCVALDCTTPHLTAWDDGNGPLLLCERHGDELAVGGFALKPGAREVSS